MLATIDVNRLGAVISSMGSRSFGARYFDLFATELGIDQCTVFAFRGSEPPDPLVLEGKSTRMRRVAHSLASEYTAGAFTRDPNVRVGRTLTTPTVYCLRAEQLSDRMYRERFYDQPSLAHELVVLGQTSGILYYSSFYRADRRAPFRPAEVEKVSGLASLAVQALHRHLELLGGAGRGGCKGSVAVPGATSSNRRPEMTQHLRDVLLAEPHGLSRREAEVCAGIILGHTTLGISLNLGMSVNTVATHRKRAYRKLGVCSQNELFSRYFQVVNQQFGAPAGAVSLASAA